MTFYSRIVTETVTSLFLRIRDPVKTDVIKLLPIPTDLISAVPVIDKTVSFTFLSWNAQNLFGKVGFTNVPPCLLREDSNLCKSSHCLS